MRGVYRILLALLILIVDSAVFFFAADGHLYGLYPDLEPGLVSRFPEQFRQK